jgi:hypothetical protein
MPELRSLLDCRFLALTALFVIGCTKAQATTDATADLVKAVGVEAPGRAGASDVRGQTDLVFELADGTLPEDQTQLINGVEVKLRTRDWPAVVITPLGAAPAAGEKAPFGKCTGSLVGPGVILFAAHCLDRRPNEVRPAFLKVDGVTIQMTCAMHPDYTKPPSKSAPSPRRSEDYALCYANTKLKLPTLEAMKFEQIDLAPVAANAAVLMMGYGCTDLTTKEQDEILRVGNATIDRAAGILGDEIAYARIVSHGPPEPALCPGDSGGPLMTGATLDKQTLPRRIRGVNSSVQDAPAGLVSRIAMLSDPRFGTWATTWISQFPDAYICGLPAGPAKQSCRL